MNLSKPSGFWNDISNQRKFMDDLFITLNYINNEDWYNLTNAIMRKNKGEYLIKKYKSSSYNLISTIYKEYDWLPWKFKNVETGFWENHENQEKYMIWLFKELKYTKLEDWYTISIRVINKEYGGTTLTQKYNSNPYKLISAIYKEYDWLPWKFHNVEESFWKDINNQKKYMIWLFEELGYTKYEDYYTLSNDHFQKNGGNGLIKEYNSSPYKLISTIYKEYTWLQWKFNQVETGFWDSPENQRKYMEWLFKKLKYKKIEDLYKIRCKDFRLNHGCYFMMAYYESNPYKIISSIYTEYTWFPWKFNQVKKGYWDDILNQRIYMDWLLKEMKYVDYTDYYKLNYINIIQNYGTTLLRIYDSNIYKLLQTIFPEFIWDIKKFPTKNSSIGEIQWLHYYLISCPKLYWSGNGQYRVPNTQNSVDGYDEDKNEILQFHGCYWHGCPTCFPNRNKINRKNKTMQLVFNETNDLKQKCISMGYKYTEMWECNWNRTICIITKFQKLWKNRK